MLFDGFVRDARRHKGTISSYIDILGALRELHRTRGESIEAQQYATLLKDVTAAFDATNTLHQWLSDERVIRSVAVETFSNDSRVLHAQQTTQAAARTIARRLVHLYEAPPSA